MAVLARDEVTLASITDVSYIRRYYLLQLSNLNAPAVPTVNPPTGSWGTTEPTYTEGSTNSLYVTDLIVFSDGTFDYLPVQKSSSYEAAKVAYNKALAAENAASTALTSANGRNSIITSTVDASGTTNPNTELALVKGDQWNKVDSLTTNNAIASWYWDGSWKAQAIKSDMIHSLDVTKLTATAARIQQAVVDKIVADIGYFNAIVVDSATAQNIAAAVANIVQARVENLVVTAGATINSAVIQKLAVEMIVAHVLRTATDPTTGLYAVMDSFGFRVIDDDGNNNEGEPETVISLGPEQDQLIQLGTGINKVSINSEGGGSFRTLSTEGLTVDGIQVDPSLILTGALGLVAFRRMDGSASRRLNGRDIVVTLECVLPKGRVYRIESTGVLTDRESSSCSPLYRLHAALNGETRPWDNWSGSNVKKEHRMPQFQQNPTASAPMSYILDLTRETSSRTLTAVVSLGNANSNGWVQARTDLDRLVITCEDLGTRWYEEGDAWYIGSTPPALPVRQTKRYYATSLATYVRGGGRDDSSGPAQGRYTSANRETFIFFPSMTSDLSGATIHSVKARCRFDHWYNNNGGTGRWHWHGHTSIPSGGSQFAHFMRDESGWARNSSRTASMVSGEFNDWKNGTRRGIAFSTSDTSYEYYGKLSTNLGEHWIDVEFSK